MALEELFQAVIDDPDADAPRLAYAEGCEAAGQRERAQFIRLQVEAAVLARQPAGEWWRPARRADQMLEPHREEWAGPVGGRVAWYDFYRGFVEVVKLDAGAFLVQAGELYRLAPIRRLVLTGVKPVVGDLFASPYLGRIVQLSMERQGLDDRDLEVLAASPYLGKLAWLDLHWNPITVAGVEALAASSGLGALRYVGLAGTEADAASEVVGEDWDGTLFPNGPGAPGAAIERRHGRKAWLHTVEDNGGRRLREAEL